MTVPNPIFNFQLTIHESLSPDLGYLWRSENGPFLRKRRTIGKWPIIL